MPKLPQDAVDFFDYVDEVESETRIKAAEDLRFGFGQQWPDYAVQSRGQERPQLTINELDSFVRQICNQQRQQRPRGRANPVDSLADPKVAKIITGIGRHIEYQSDADTAYDTAFEYAVRMGFGYWRIITDYIDEKSFYQDIYIKPILRPFSVYFDPNSELPDGSDAECCLIVNELPKASFKKLYPDANSYDDFPSATSDAPVDWVNKDTIRVAEYFHTDKKKDTLIALSNGMMLWKNELPPTEILAMSGLQIIGDRQSWRKEVQWQKQTCSEILDSNIWASKYLPIIPVYGEQIYVDNKRHRYGIIRHAKDAQRMTNFWFTSITESIALAPKAKWVGPEGFNAGHENKWAKANISPDPVLTYQTEVDGREIPPPQRLQPEPPPQGAIAALQITTNSLQRVLGMFDPAIRTNQTVKSARTIAAEQNQSDQSNFHIYDNFTKSVKHTWRCILDLIPVIYDSERIVRIIGDDEKQELVTVNQKGGADSPINKILNDVTIGHYDVVIETGPGYRTKREEAVAALIEMSKGIAGDILWKAAGDVIVRNMDFPNADVIADRLSAMNPMSKVDENSEIPPVVQLKMRNDAEVIKELQGVVQQLQMELKYKTNIVQMQEDGDTKRALIKATADADKTQKTTDAKIYDSDAKALTAQNTQEIKGMTDIMLRKIEKSEAP